jgi:hypothetical protein
MSIERERKERATEEKCNSFGYHGYRFLQSCFVFCTFFCPPGIFLFFFFFFFFLLLIFGFLFLGDVFL